MNLKNYHIQQDSSDGCSLASFIMLDMLLTKKHHFPDMQYHYRGLLASSKNEQLFYWLGRVNRDKYRRGIPSASFYKSVKEFIKVFDRQYTVKLVSMRRKSSTRFKCEMEEYANDPKKQVIFNYDGHYSPLGEFADDIITIYDVDWVERYDQEFYYLNGDGEYYVHCYSFYKKLKRQKRNYLLFSAK